MRLPRRRPKPQAPELSPISRRSRCLPNSGEFTLDMFHSLALDHGALVNEVADWLQQLKMRLRSITSLNMPQLAVEAFVANIERLGVRLSATRLADGRMRLNRWRTPDAVINAQQIGAYGHSPMREALFGGCTHSFIQRADRPVLLTH
jgi:hypothetical protein